MGAPSRLSATAGRLNPEGIPYLYLAKEQLTAVAEARPWRGAMVSMATFEVTKDIELYDFTLPPADAHTFEDFLVRNLGIAFSTPAHHADRTAYGATQYLSEQLKDAGAGRVLGILYPSALQPNGVNVALFGGLDGQEEWPAVRCLESALWNVTAIHVEAKPWDMIVAEKRARLRGGL
jgi:RES domain-containing protein